jgi:hypothetical protein
MVEKANGQYLGGQRQSGRSNRLSGLWRLGLDSSVRAGGDGNMGRVERNDGWQLEPFIQDGTMKRVRGIGQPRVSTEGGITYFAIHFCFPFPNCVCFFGYPIVQPVRPHPAKGGGLFGLCFCVNCSCFPRFDFIFMRVLYN